MFYSFKSDQISRTWGFTMWHLKYTMLIKKNWENRDWVIGFLKYFWWFLRSYIVKTAIFKIWVFWAKTMHSITLYAIDIYNIRCFNHFYHSMATLKIGGYWDWTGGISWNYVIRGPLRMVPKLPLRAEIKAKWCEISQLFEWSEISQTFPHWQKNHCLQEMQFPWAKLKQPELCSHTLDRNSLLARNAITHAGRLVNWEITWKSTHPRNQHQGNDLFLWYWLDYNFAKKAHKISGHSMRKLSS